MFLSKKVISYHLGKYIESGIAIPGVFGFEMIGDKLLSINGDIYNEIKE